MDTSALITQQANVQGQIDTAKSDLATLQSELATVDAQLAEANFVNQIEALSADEVASTNTLLNEPSNTRGILLTIANPNG